MTSDLVSLVGAEAKSLLGHTSSAIPKERLTLPGPSFVDTRLRGK